ncbi:MAG: hypothetical protein H8E60_09690 [Candidatus Marinimicrobia bacterium]|nr:hypothetical protein [Candidatus Neomarinimicrobiota bacterium]
MAISFIQIAKDFFINIFAILGYKVLVWDDETNPTFTNYQMRGNFARIIEGDLGSGGNIDISGDAYISKENDIFVYGLLVKCNVKNCLNFLQQNVFILNVDGKLISFDINDDFYSIDEVSILDEKYFVEIDRFLIDKEIMKLLANSTNVEFKINGEKQTIEGYLSNKNIRRFREFYYDYLL